MKTKWNILLIAAVAGLAACAGGAPQRGRPVEEGYLAAGTEGRIAKEPNSLYWTFYPKVEITDGKGVLPVDKGVSLLPCSGLEQMVQLAGEAGTLDVRLWAMATEYRGANYLYSLYFLPMRATEDAAAKPAEPAAPAAPKAESGEKESVLPSEILQMIQRNRVPDLKRLDELITVSSDRNMIHRTGVMRGAEDGFVFAGDAFGQNVGQGAYRLLPSRALETMERTMQRTLGRQRYVVSGVETGFEGTEYLLLRRAVRTFTHGNFTP